MIGWLSSPEHFADEALLADFHTTDGEDDRACMLRAEIETRNFDL